MIPDPFVIRIELERASLTMVQAIQSVMDVENLKALVAKAVADFDYDAAIKRAVQQVANDAILRKAQTEFWRREHALTGAASPLAIEKMVHAAMQNELRRHAPRAKKKGKKA